MQIVIYLIYFIIEKYTDMCYIITKQFSTLPVRLLLEILILLKMIVYGGNDGRTGSEYFGFCLYYLENLAFKSQQLKQDFKLIYDTALLI